MRLYLAIAAGCIPVLISDAFEGAFPQNIPWQTFTVRFAEAEVAEARVARRGRAPLRSCIHGPRYRFITGKRTGNPAQFPTAPTNAIAEAAMP